MQWVLSKIHNYCHPILLLLILAGLVACGATPPADSQGPVQITLRTPVPLFTLPTPPPKTARPVSEMQRGWLRDTPCQAPCWEGITPGQTSVKEAVEILNRHPFTTDPRFGSLPSDEEGTLVWLWNKSTQGS